MGLLTRRHTRDLRNHNFDLREGWGVIQFYATLNHATWIAQNGLSLQGIAFAAAQDMMTGMLTHGLTPPIYHQTAYASLRNPVFCLRQTAIWLIWHNTKPRVLDSTNWTLHDAHLTFHDIFMTHAISVAFLCPASEADPAPWRRFMRTSPDNFQSWAGHVRRDRRARCPSCQARPSSASAFTELANEANGERGERGKRKSLFEPFEKRLGFRKGFRKGSRKGLRQLRIPSNLKRSWDVLSPS